jgi:hypothetical protein
MGAELRLAVGPLQEHHYAARHNERQFAALILSGQGERQNHADGCI